MLKNKLMTVENISLIALTLVSFLSRVIKHDWNFTAVFAASFVFVIMFPKSKFKSFIVLFISMLLSDAIIGFHNSMAFVYLGFALALVPAFYAQKTLSKVASLLFGSLIFFLISNFGVWFSGGLYTHDVNGLMNCFTMGLPFYRNQFLSDILLTPSLMVLVMLAKNNITTVYRSNEVDC